MKGFKWDVLVSALWSSLDEPLRMYQVLFLVMMAAFFQALLGTGMAAATGGVIGFYIADVAKFYFNIKEDTNENE